MTAQPDHDEVVRQSFEKQVGLFDGDDALFARRADPAVSWLGPLSPDMIVLDVACGAGHVAETLYGYEPAEARGCGSGHGSLCVGLFSPSR